MTNEDKVEKIKQLREEADQLESGPEKTGETAQELSPRTKLPVADPESQAVERIHYEMQQSLASRATKKEVEDAIGEE